METVAQQRAGAQRSGTSPLYQVLAEDIVAMGVEAAFGLISDDTALLATALDTSGARFYGARHENCAIAMADGYAMPPAGWALRPRGPLLAFRHSQMGWLPPTERYRCAAFQHGIPIAPAGRALLISSARADGFHGRFRGNRLSGAPCPRARHATGRVRAASDDRRRRAHCSGRLASARDLGGDGTRHHGVGAGAALARFLDRVVVRS